MAQHVTFWRMQVKPGKVQELQEAMGGDEEARMKAAGWTASIVGTRKDDPNEVWGAVTWDTSERYRKNAENPEQNEWYQKMRQLLTADPDWYDCDVIEERRA